MKKKDLLDKWLNGEVTPAEFEVLTTMPEFSSYQRIDGFVKRMELPDIDIDSALHKVKAALPIKKKAPKVISLSTIIKIAAVLVVIAASYIFVSSLSTSIHTDLAETHSLVLPDASKVTVNETSEITFNKRNWAENRIVSLNGEAYFDVAKGTSFDVVTAYGTISVLGTKFNVLATGDFFKISCFEGMVLVKNATSTVTLSKGKTATLEGNDLIVDEVFTSKPGWIFDESSFDDTSILHVLKELETQYKLTVTTENIDVNLRFTGSFAHNDLETALQSITIPLNLSYRIEDPNAVILYTETVQE
jgi:ferric-dicitrate binding protein FerR (iron transport regulator)